LEIIKTIMRSELNVNELLEGFSPEMKKLVSECLNKKDVERPTFEEIAVK